GFARDGLVVTLEMDKGLRRRGVELLEGCELLVRDVDVDGPVEDAADVAYREDDVAVEEEAPFDDEGCRLAWSGVDEGAVDFAELSVRLLAPDGRVLLDVGLVAAAALLLVIQVGALAADLLRHGLDTLAHGLRVKLLGLEVHRRVEVVFGVGGRISEVCGG